MSKFRDTPPSDPKATGDATVIPFPVAAPADGPGEGGMTREAALERQAEIKRLNAELDVFANLAVAELLLRGRYRDLMEMLDLVEARDAVPDDWREKLKGVDFLAAADFGDEQEEEEEDKEEEEEL